MILNTLKFVLELRNNKENLKYLASRLPLYNFFDGRSSSFDHQRNHIHSFIHYFPEKKYHTHQRVYNTTATARITDTLYLLTLEMPAWKLSAIPPGNVPQNREHSQ